MDRERAWVIPGLTGLVTLGCLYFSLGGFAGIVRDPGQSLAVAAIVIAVTVPILWLSYRRLRRQPIIVPVSEAKSSFSAADQLDRPPLVLLASQWKLLGRLTFAGLTSALFVGISIAQPGVCRVVSVGLLGPFLIWNIVFWALCLWRPDRLAFAPEGMSHRSFRTVRHWTWDEVREIRLVKRQIPIIGRFLRNRPTASILFKRYGPPGHTAGPAFAGVMSIWRMSGDDLAALMEVARSKWSTPEGSSFVPVGGMFRTYFRTGLIMLLMGALCWMWLTQPCAR